MAGSIVIKGYSNTKTPIKVPKVKSKVIKNYILVSGLDYHDIWSFKKYADKEKTRILSNINSKETLVIYNIDILSGKITITEDKKTKKVIDYDEITKKNYAIGHSFDSLGKTNYITKDVIYKIIEEISIKDPNSLKEVHVFSHAYWNGPILANTSESDPIDIDMRREDVLVQGTYFNNSMDVNGFVKIWGCSFPRDLNYFFSRIRKNPSYSSSKPIKDSEIFSYKSNHFVKTECIDIINDSLSKTFKLSDKIQLTFKEIKKIAAIQYRLVFAGYLAKYGDINVYAALPATYAEIVPTFIISSKTSSNVEFYTQHMGIKTDSGNYGLYDKKTIEKFEKL